MCRGSRKETLDGGRKNKWIRKEEEDGSDDKSSVTVTLRTATGFSSNHKPLWWFACLIFCIYESSYKPQLKEKGGRWVQLAAEDGGGEIAALSQWPLCFRAFVCQQTFI